MKDLLRKIRVGSALVSALTGCKLVTYVPQEVVTVDPERYEWIDVKGNQGILWEAYMQEKISHNTVAWERYQKLVRRGNQGPITTLPSVDGDSLVYLGGRYFALVDSTQQKQGRSAEVREDYQEERK